MRFLEHLDFDSVYKIVDAEDLKIFSIYESRLEDLCKIEDALRSLSTDASPANSDKVIKHEWGTDCFFIGRYFIKAVYSFRNIDKEEPFLGSAEMIINNKICTDLMLPVPRLVAFFSVKQNGKWLWNGIVSEKLEGYSNLNESDEEAFLDLAKRISLEGISHDDFYPSNAMKGPEGVKLVDLDCLSFGLKPEDAYRRMVDQYERWKNFNSSSS